MITLFHADANSIFERGDVSEEPAGGRKEQVNGEQDFPSHRPFVA